jgi:hypothetical protein
VIVVLVSFYLRVYLRSVRADEVPCVGQILEVVAAIYPKCIQGLIELRTVYFDYLRARCSVPDQSSNQLAVRRTNLATQVHLFNIDFNKMTS